MATHPFRRTLRTRAEDHAEVLDEIDEELAHHLELSARDGVAEGLSPEEARAQAMQRFGDLTRIRRACERQRIPGERLMWKTLAVLTSLAAIGTSFAWQVEVRSKSARIAELRSALAAAQDSARAESHAPPVPLRDWIQVGDLVRVTNHTDPASCNSTQLVQRDGCILLPDVGWLRIEDLTFGEARETLDEAFAPYSVDAPEFEVEVVWAAPVRIEPLEHIVVAPLDTLTFRDEVHPEEFCGEALVESDGTAFLPELGNVHVAGMTRAEAEKLLSSRLAARFVEAPVVRVVVTTP